LSWRDWLCEFALAGDAHPLNLARAAFALIVCAFLALALVCAFALLALGCFVMIRRPA
jgi:hypothetical protein